MFLCNIFYLNAAIEKPEIFETVGFYKKLYLLQGVTQFELPLNYATILKV